MLVSTLKGDVNLYYIIIYSNFNLNNSFNFINNNYNIHYERKRPFLLLLKFQISLIKHLIRLFTVILLLFLPLFNPFFKLITSRTSK